MLLDHLCLAKSKAYTGRKKVVGSRSFRNSTRRRRRRQKAAAAAAVVVVVVVVVVVGVGVGVGKVAGKLFSPKTENFFGIGKTEEQLFCSCTYFLSFAASASATASAAASATASATASARASSTANDTAGIC